MIYLEYLVHFFSFGKLIFHPPNYEQGYKKET